MNRTAQARRIMLHPLNWPVSKDPRQWTREKNPRESRFSGDVTVAQAARELYAQCEKVTGCIESSIVITVGNGTANPTRDVDQGAAVYFTSIAGPIVFACDRWKLAAHNVWALARHIEAMRAMERWGVGNTRQAFAGYTNALPPASSTERHPNASGSRWRVWLGFENRAMPSIEEINAAFRVLAKEYHPDAGGSEAKMKELNNARDEALAELASKGG